MNELKTYFKDVGRHPVLKRPVLMGLFKELTEAENSALKQKLKQKIMLANLRLVVAEAKKWRRPHVALDDIIQEGNIGLMRAIEKFDIIHVGLHSQHMQGGGSSKQCEGMYLVQPVL